MTNGASNFVIQVFDDPFTFSFILSFSFLFIFLVYKKHVYLLFDWFTILLISICIQITVVLFGTLKINSNPILIYYTVFSFLVFFLGFYIFSKKLYYNNKINLRYHSLVIKNDCKILFMLCFTSYILCRFYLIYNSGINIGSGEKFSYFRSIPLGGLYHRLIYIFRFVILTYLFLKIILNNYRFSSSVLLLCIFITFECTTANKSFLVHMFIHYLTVKIITYSITKKYFNYNFKIIIFLCFISVIGIILLNSDTIYMSAYKLGWRFLMYGDIHMFVLFGDILQHIKPGNFIDGLMMLFKDFLGFYRIYEWHQLPKEFCNTIFRLITNSDTLKAPNPTHIFFGYYYFSWFGLLFSFICGSLIGFVRGLYLFNIKPKFSSILLYIIILQITLTFSVDPTYSIQNFNNLIVFFLPLFMLSRFISHQFK